MVVKKGFINVLSKKALTAAAAVAISGVVPAGLAVAQGELVAELVATGDTEVSGTPGQKVTVPVKIYVTPIRNQTTNEVTVTAYFAGETKKTVTFAANEFDKENGRTVYLDYTVPQTTATQVTPKVEMESTSTNGNGAVINDTPDTVTINVIQPQADQQSPDITISNDSAIFNADTVPIAFSYFVTVTDNKDLNPFVTYKEGEIQVNTPPTSEGTHTITVTATDATSNSSTKTFTYTVDRTAPAIAISNDGVKFNSDKTTKSFSDFVTVTDNMDSNPTKVYKEGNSPVTELPTSAGAHTITVIATDAAKNSSTSNFSYTVVNTAPEIKTLNSELLFNPDRTTKSFNDFVVVTDPTDDHPTVVYKEGNTELTTLPTSVGEHTITVIATNSVGNSSTNTFFYTVDKAAPEFTLSNIGLHFNSDNITKSFTDFVNVTDNYDSNPSKVFKENDSVITELPTTEGPHTITVVTEDSAGNSSNTTFSYTVDNSVPEAAVSSKNGLHFNSDITNKSFGDFVTITDNFDGTPTVVYKEGNDSLDSLPASEGAHTITFVASDSAGNSSNGSFSYTVDTSGPLIELSNEGLHFNPIGSPMSLGDFVSVSDTYDEELDVVYKKGADTLSSLPISEGVHSITVTATDSVGNSSSKTFSYTVDKTAPVITTSTNNLHFNSETAMKNFTDFFEVNDVYDENPTVIFKEGDSPIESLPSSLGVHSITVIATDSAGNSSTNSFSYTVDNTGPVIKLSHSGLQFNPDKVTKSFADFITVTDDSDRNPTVRYREFEEFVTALPVTEGPHTIYVSASDSAGNSSNESISYIVDKTAPVITLSSNDGVHFNSINTPKTFIDFASTVDTYDSNPNVIYKEGDTTLTSLPNTEGVHTITVTAVDSADNRSSKTFSYTVDNSGPDITIWNDGLHFNSGDSPKTFTDFSNVVDAYDSRVDVVYKEGDSLIDSLPDSAGMHTITVIATDSLGNSSNNEFSYTVDNEAPVITISNNGLHFNSIDSPKTFDDFATVADADEDLEILFKEGGINYSSLPSTEGVHTITVTAEDSAGNHSTETFLYTVDNMAPVITLANEDLHFNSETSLKNFTDFFQVDDNFDDNPALVYKEGETVLETLPAKPGRHTITIIATDSAGNSSSEQVPYTVDNKAPKISLSNNGLHFNSDNISKSLSDFITVIDDFDGHPNVIYKEFDQLVTVLPISEGHHTIQIVATDSAGNRSNETLIYTVDKTAPTVTITNDGLYFNNEATPKDFEDFVSVIDELDLDPTITYKKGNSEVTSLPTDEGNHTISVIATDEAGNQSEVVEFSYTVDYTAPEIEVISNNLYFNNDEDPKSFESFISVSDALDGHPVVTYKEGDTEVASLPVTSGHHTITAIAKDAADNESVEVTFSYTVDFEAPMLTVNADNLYFNNDTDEKSFADFVSVSDNFDKNPLITYLEGTVEITELPTDEGHHTITAFATDLAGNHSAIVEFSYTVDNLNPVLTVNANNLYFNNETDQKSFEDFVSVSDNLDDDPVVTYFEENNEVSELPTGEGLHTITAIATDMARNQSEEVTFSYTVDYSDPVIKISNNNLYFNLEKTPKAIADFVNVTDLDKNPTVTYKEGDQLLTELPSSEGPHTIKVIVEDAAHNKATEEFTYTIDNSIPVFKDINITNGAYYNSTTLPLPEKLQYTLDEINLEDDSSTIRNGTPLNREDGNYSITLNAVDKAGNEANPITINYTVDTTNPTIDLSAMKAAYFVGDQTPLTFRVTDANFESKTAKYANGTEIKEGDNINTTAPGKYQIIVTATDKAGNKTIETINYKVYSFSDILEPINTKGTKSSFKKGSTIPVKFRLFDINGTNGGASATLSYKRVGNSTDGIMYDAVSSSAATTGNNFRYENQQYIFNLSTKDFSTGEYTLYIKIFVNGTEIEKAVNISIRN